MASHGTAFIGPSPAQSFHDCIYPSSLMMSALLRRPYGVKGNRWRRTNRRNQSIPSNPWESGPLGSKNFWQPKFLHLGRFAETRVLCRRVSSQHPLGTLNSLLKSWEIKEMPTLNTIQKMIYQVHPSTEFLASIYHQNSWQPPRFDSSHHIMWPALCFRETCESLSCCKFLFGFSASFANVKASNLWKQHKYHKSSSTEVPVVQSNSYLLLCLTLLCWLARGGRCARCAVAGSLLHFSLGPWSAITGGHTEALQLIEVAALWNPFPRGSIHHHPWQKGWKMLAMLTHSVKTEGRTIRIPGLVLHCLGERHQPKVQGICC